ncbi:SH3 domain-containing protein [Streptomyces sioyaensis]|uniref:SH3 domain-containing protein n=1 Tax=Streptomyces sioyaensis TaxID=67364 RepID=UPI0037B7076C
MRKHLITAGIGAAAVSSLLMVSAPAASAATHTFYTTESVRLRAKPTTHSTALALIPKGANVKAQMDKFGGINWYTGSKHNACGSKGYIHDDTWSKVTYKGITGYTAFPCLMPR